MNSIDRKSMSCEGGVRGMILGMILMMKSRHNTGRAQHLAQLEAGALLEEGARADPDDLREYGLLALIELDHRVLIGRGNLHHAPDRVPPRPVVAAAGAGAACKCAQGGDEFYGEWEGCRGGMEARGSPHTMLCACRRRLHQSRVGVGLRARIGHHA